MLVIQVPARCDQHGLMLTDNGQCNECQRIVDNILATGRAKAVKHCATCQCSRAFAPMPRGAQGEFRKRSWHHDTLAPLTPEQVGQLPSFMVTAP